MTLFDKDTNDVTEQQDPLVVIEPRRVHFRDFKIFVDVVGRNWYINSPNFHRHGPALSDTQVRVEFSHHREVWPCVDRGELLPMSRLDLLEDVATELGVIVDVYFSLRYVVSCGKLIVRSYCRGRRRCT